MTEEVSNSRVDTWQKCRQLYDLRFNKRLVPRIDAPYLRGGNLVHHGIEMGLRAQFIGADTRTIMLAIDNSITKRYGEWADHKMIRPLLEADSDIWDAAIDHANVCKDICQRVFDRFGIFAGRWETQTLGGVPLIEYKMRTRMPEERMGVKLDGTGTLDWVAKDLESGHTWLIDWKSRKSLMGPEYDETNRQASNYQHLLGLEGIKLNGTCSAQIRSMKPKIPRINSGKGKFHGQMSRSAISTDWHTYRQALVEAGLDPADYAAMEEKLGHFEELVFTFRSPKEVEATWNDYLDAVEEWHENSYSGPFFRSLNTWNCQRCAYKDPCMEALRGGDVDALIEALYMKDYDGPRSWMYGNAPEEEGEA